MADRIKNYQQGADEISILKDIRATLGVTPSSYTPDATEVTRDRVVTFAQAEEELSVLGDIQTGMQQFVADTKFQVGENTGDIANIKALLQGQLYNYQTDSTVAYTKTVPSGALPYAGIETLGGRTVVWNQQCKTTRSGETKNGITFTNNGDGSWTINGTAEASSNVYFDVITLNLDHKYLLRGCPAGGSSSTYYLGFNGHDTDTGSGGIETPTSVTTGNFRFNFHTGDSFDNVTVYPQIFDLTLMYGSGNEPTTVAEFEAMFPADYYPYNAGTLLSAGVTEVESVGVNMMPPAPAGTQIVNGITATSDGAGTYKISGTATASTYIYFDIPTFTTPVSAGRGGEYVFALNNSVNSYAVNFKFYNGTTQVDSWGTVPANRYVYSYNALADKTVNRVGITVTDGETVDMEISPAFVPYKADYPTTPTSYHVFYKYVAEISMPIPAEVRALEGYGWSAGTAYNYIDYERKVFVKCVDRIVLDGTQNIVLANWRPQTNSVGWMYAYSLTNHKPPATQYTTPNIVADKVEVVSYNRIYNNDKNCISAINGTNYGLCLRIANTSLTDSTAINAYMSANPITVYYELATPVETDISAYLTDNNLVQVEPAGTVTFENQNGDDYRIPVPSDVTYMIDLQAAINDEEE